MNSQSKNFILASFILLCFITTSSQIFNISPLIKGTQNESEESLSQSSINCKGDTVGPFAVEWNRRYVPWLMSYTCRDIALDAAENIYMVGSHGGIYKYDKDGVLKWEVDEIGSFYSIALDSSDNIIAVGDDYDEIVVVKYSKSGSFIWRKFFLKGTKTHAYSVAVDNSNNVYVAGDVFYASGALNMLLIKYSSSGGYQWDLDLSFDQWDIGRAVAIDTSGNFYIAGYTWSQNSPRYKFGIAKYNSIGLVEWKKTWYNHPLDDTIPYDMILDSQDNIYLTGYTYVDNTLYDQLILTKFDNTGSLIWKRLYGDLGFECGWGLDLDAEENVYVVGRDYSSSWDILTLIYSPGGNLKYSNLWGDSVINRGYSIAVASSGNYYIGGEYAVEYGDGELFLIKFNPVPHITVHSPSQNQIFTSLAPNFNVNIEDNDLIETFYKINGEGYYIFTGDTGTINQTGWDVCPNGTVSLRFSAKDIAGGVYEEVIVRKDVLGPPFNITYPVSNFTYGELAPTFKLEIDEADYDSIWYTLNNSQPHFSPSSQGTINQAAWELLGNGTIQVCFYTNDSHGNIATKDILVKKDIYIPFIIVHNPYENQIFGVAAPSYNISISSVIFDSAWYTLNNGLNHPILSDNGVIDQLAWSSCPNGTISIKFYAKNSLNQIGITELHVIKDTRRPNITLISPTSYLLCGNRSITYELSIPNPDIDTIWYSLNKGYNITSSGLTGKIDLDAWNSCPNGTVLITFYANNSLGNIGLRESIVRKDLDLLYPRKVYGIIIGVENYPGTGYDLNYCKDDAVHMVNHLRIAYNIKTSSIKTFYDSDATKNIIVNRFSLISNEVYPDDIFFFYFSGHGGIDAGHHFICPYDSLPFNPSKLLYDYELAILLNTINTNEKYIFVDSCNSGGIIPEIQASGRFITTACEASQDSWETSELQHGVFTYFLVNAFDNAHDSNGDGLLSMKEQTIWANTETLLYTLDLGVPQAPVRYDGISGPELLHPALGNLIFTLDKDTLNYSFTLFGTGTIISLDLSIYSVIPDITTQTINLLQLYPSSTGFGHYSGTFTLSNHQNITCYQLSVNISGDDTVILEEFFDTDTDGDGLSDRFEINLGIGLDPRLSDTDNDGLSDFEEYYGITDPVDSDTDSDGMLDGFEVIFGLDPLINDTALDLDNDGLTNIQEYNLGTTVNDPDTDGDGMHDGYEVFYGLDVFNDDAILDMDSDGLINLYEFQAGAMPNKSDSDDDTMPDLWEYENQLDLMFNDTAQDYDSDGLSNLFEFQLGSIANNSDTDGDAMPDGWEYNNGLDVLTNDANFDPDNDQLINLEEYYAGTDINNPDTDYDLMYDGWEFYNSLNPLANDTALDPDADGLTNIEEYYYNTDPQLEDTDGDTWNDGEEVEHGTDPLDPNDHPSFPNAISGYHALFLACMLLVCSIVIGKKLKFRKYSREN